MKRLPKKLGKLLTLALDDLEEIEKDSRYRVCMANFHGPSKGGDKCQVCLAGAVMANTFKTDHTKVQMPHDFSSATDNALRALDSLRQGHIYNAQQYMRKGIRRDIPSRVPITPYHFEPEHFKAELRALAKLLTEKNV